MLRKRTAVVTVLAITLGGATVQAKDLGDILLKKGLITQEELQQAREEDKQKAAADESRRDAIMAKLPKWLDMLTPFGDIRVREEGFYGDFTARNRGRFRARVGLNANVSDEVSGTVRLASGNPDDPISTNQSFERTFTRKPVNLDQAYITIKPGKTFGLEPGWGSITGGKFGTTTYRVSETVWDDDLSPEGASETLNLWERREGLLRGVKVNALQWTIDELSASSDPWVAGAQMVGDMALGTTATMTLAFADYSFQNMNSVAKKYLNQFTDPPTNSKSNSSYNSQLATSNDLAKNANGLITGYKYGFNVVNPNGELNFPDPVGLGIPAGIFGDLVYNTQADTRNTGFAVGVGVGKAGKDWYHNSLKNPGDWGVAYTYSWIEKDAVLSLFNYSDDDYVQSFTRKNATQKGNTNVSSNIVRFDYVLLPNLQLTAKAHMINALDRKASNASLNGNPTMFRTQLDAVLKF